jgi:shikimate 5-dehydrogenase
MMKLKMCCKLICCRTFLLKEAEKRGWQTAEGVEVMICQAIEQQLIWTGKPQESMKVEEVAEMVRNHGSVGEPQPKL